MKNYFDCSSLSRRLILARFLKGTAIVATGVSPLIGCGSNDKKTTGPLDELPGGDFQHGVASGDPSDQAVILWTRVAPLATNTQDDDIPVSWEIAADENFSALVNAGTAMASAQRDYTFKVDAQGLQPGTHYFYRFSTASHQSITGVTKTLPTGSVDKVSFAVVSCSNYPAGYFHVYREIANLPDLDAIIHLGDYIYEYASDGYASKKAEAMGRSVMPAHELLTLADYRQRYAQYRQDEDLQAAHRAAPFIAVWDDHEVANDAWREGAENHNDGEGAYRDRLEAALRAYAEWMPIRPPVDEDIALLARNFEFGQLVNLSMLDTRLVGRDKQLDLAAYFSSGEFDAAAYAADIGDSSRTLLGVSQREWLLNQFASSATWQVLGQQVLMGTMALPAAVATQQLTIAEFTELAQLAQIAVSTPEQLTTDQRVFVEQKSHLLQLGILPYNLDAWDGYPAERAMLLAAAQESNARLVVLAGDTHNAWVNQLNHNGDVVGLELAVPSVTSPGLEGYLQLATEQQVAQTEMGLVQLIDTLQYTNLANRGYLAVSFTPQAMEATFYFIDAVDQLSYRVLEAREHRVRLDS
ncbi:MAG TPA: alkaline phosphatase D family protein [Marinagarivorans sp.]